MTEKGTLYGTSGDDRWPVTYRVHTTDVGLVGDISFAPRTQLQPYNRAQPAYLRLRDGRWARVQLDKTANQTTYAVGEGSAFTDPPEWLARQIREGNIVPVPCDDCGGELRADKDFVLRHGQSMTNPDESEPFWSTTCQGCGARFNYTARTGRLTRI